MRKIAVAATLTGPRTLTSTISLAPGEVKTASVSCAPGRFRSSSTKSAGAWFSSAANGATLDYRASNPTTKKQSITLTVKCA